jgi:phage-related protein
MVFAEPPHYLNYIYLYIINVMKNPVNPLVWIASSKKDLQAMPQEVQRAFGYGLFQAQCGKRPEKAKSLTGFGSAGVIEMVEDTADSTYRAVYTVRFGATVYVLHCFQKKSTQGRKTPKREMDLIRQRLKVAEALAQQEP